MGSRWSVEWEARRLNQQQSPPITVRSYSVASFWQSVSEHFMVLGGDRLTRRGILLRKLAYDLSDGPDYGMATLVITNDPELGSRALGLPAAHGCLLAASGPRYPNYDFFYGMKNVDIARFFGGLAKHGGYGRAEEVEQFAGGLLAVLSSFEYPSLSGIRKLMQFSNEKIRDRGIQLGITRSYLLDSLVSSYQGGQLFRQLVDSLANEFRALGAGPGAGTKVNLLTTVAGARRNGTRGLHVVDVGGLRSALINRYLAAELQYIINARIPFNLIVDGLVFDQDDILDSVVNAVRNAGTGTVGILMGNPWRSFKREEELRGYPAMMVLPRGDELDGDSLTRLRKVFGSYTHHEPTREGTFLEPRWRMTSFTRDRVSMEDAQRAQAICQISGNGDIYLVQTLKM